MCLFMPYSTWIYIIFFINITNCFPKLVNDINSIKLLHQFVCTLLNNILLSRCTVVENKFSYTVFCAKFLKTGSIFENVTNNYLIEKDIKFK